jgi:hypothetical protein
MKSSFTLNDLIVFAFNDTLEVVDDHSSDDMESKSQLAREWRCILESNPWGDQNSISPVAARMANILAYSMALEVYNSSRVGSIFRVMN